MIEDIKLVLKTRRWEDVKLLLTRRKLKRLLSLVLIFILCLFIFINARSIRSFFYCHWVGDYNIATTDAICRPYLDQSLTIDKQEFIALMDAYLESIKDRISIGNSKLYNGPFVISLDKDTKRYNNTQERLSRFGLNTIRFPAFDPRMENTKQRFPSVYNFLMFDDFDDIRHKENGMGCSLSHLLIYHYISKLPNSQEYTLIFEDDVSYFESDIERLNNLPTKIEKAINYKKDIIHLGKCFEFCPEISQIEGDIYTAVRPLCLHAYLIKNTFAKKIINYVLNVPLNKIEPIDWLPAKALDIVECKSCYYVYKRSNIISFHPSLFYQDVKFESNLRTDSDRGSQHECVPWKYMNFPRAHHFIDKTFVNEKHEDA